MQHTMTRMEELFADRTVKRFIPFITVGDPSLDVTFELVHKLIEAGADVIELGVPYSDPLADGPIIQRASQRALAQGVKLKDAIRLGERLRASGVSIPLVIFTYCNPVMQYGVERFFADLRAYGLDGAIIPDLPFEESAEARGAAKKNGIHLIQLIAPTSQERIEMIGKEADGFLYCVSSLGVTGVRDNLPFELDDLIKTARENSSIPVAVGFGISSPEQVRAVAGYADAVIVGSAIVREVEKNIEALSSEEMRNSGLERVKKFVKSLSNELK
ncbi:tryptophan synthase subunit alpha [Brevibacillus laterosporus]|uniref:Tryptophan synthase alpha chain n=1 Tax=Brevibacillus laterosporus LMG 15441 TaxID=1042163 RepID=A0A075R512_BRELA|nr:MULTISPECIES: tryptophan synthase subunit alpha [Brevibacillus]AIG26248.1 tryptophan synthase alpha chain [Brevibacillus laterosporus LMG 15441]MCR8964509.1 tryptophan synthase subunit alpha [Brevibacillus laterosporus]MCZ0836664.1 tryptophan synthase subunit alpha [Brevibacillus halotolerans]RJL12422.1 tryptophan synthase subunit alpha [Brevibacillus laterosporus]TPH07377.1 tryptophan synthase subunit alpha [Brevibacillus laterosporus]